MSGLEAIVSIEPCTIESSEGNYGWERVGEGN